MLHAAGDWELDNQASTIACKVGEKSDLPEASVAGRIYSRGKQPRARSCIHACARICVSVTPWPMHMTMGTGARTHVYVYVYEYVCILHVHVHMYTYTYACMHEICVISQGALKSASYIALASCSVRIAVHVRRGR